MRRSTSFLPVLMFSAVTVLLDNLSSVEAGGNCQGKLVGNSYDCSFTDNDTLPFTECWEFFTGGVSQYFDLDFGLADYGCACNPTGSSFNHSSSTFECSDSVEFFMVNGKIKGKKLSVQGVGSSGEQYVGTCTLRSSPCL